MNVSPAPLSKARSEMATRRIAVVTGSRAEYGILYWLLRDMQEDPDLDLRLIVTGMHLSSEFGMTIREIEKDGLPIARRVEMLLSSDSHGGAAKSLGLGVIGMSEALEELKPDLVLLLGDRFEILAAAQAALIHTIPVGHIAGGDTSEGAFDESIRHAITKMAHFHFVTHASSGARVLQMGENPDRVFIVGHLGLDHLNRLSLLDREALEKSLGASLGTKNLLVTFHPETLEPSAGETQLGELLAALHDLPPEIVLWITKPNADPGGRALARQLEGWCEMHSDRAHLHTSLGHLRYLSLMAQVQAVVGNSSSGLYEAPSFQIPTVDVGDRQKGRLRAASVLHCPPERMAIGDTLRRALAMDCSGVVNPYGDGRTSARILEILKSVPLTRDTLKKPFFMRQT